MEVCDQKNRKRAIVDPKVGEEWLEFRERHLLTQSEMALALGLTRRTVQGVERSEHMPTFRSRKRFKDLVERYGKVV